VLHRPAQGQNVTRFDSEVTYVGYTNVRDIFTRRDQFVVDLAMAREKVESDPLGEEIKALVHKYVFKSEIMEFSWRQTDRHRRVLIDTLKEMVDYMQRRIVYSALRMGRVAGTRADFLYVEETVDEVETAEE
jgi:hypothetical protein